MNRWITTELLVKAFGDPNLWVNRKGSIEGYRIEVMYNKDVLLTVNYHFPPGIDKEARDLVMQEAEDMMHVSLLRELAFGKPTKAFTDISGKKVQTLTNILNESIFNKE